MRPRLDHPNGIDIEDGDNRSSGPQSKGAVPSNIAVPKDDQFHHPLAAVYRVDTVLPAVEALLAEDRLRPFFLFERCSTREVAVNELRNIDPDLVSLMNLNRLADYRNAIRIAGFDVDSDGINQATDRP